MNNVTRKNRKNNNSNMVGGKMLTVGSKSQVYHGTAKHTSGGLTKKGRIVSKRKHAAGKKALKRLYAKGFKPKKGTFKLFH